MNRTEWHEIERRQGVPREVGGRIFLLVVGLGILAMAWNHSMRRIDRATDDATSPVILGETPVDSVAQESPAVPESYPATLFEPRQRAPARQGTLTVYECVVAGQKVYSDQPCGDDAREKAVIVSRPDAENAARARYLTQQAQSPTRYDGNPAASAAVSTRSGSAMQANRCAAIDQQIDWINARMRQGYRAYEGERLRDSLRALKSDRYDLRCGR
jgi:hypothetical protein